nr:isoform 4 of h(+)/cl(-) exchange transporter 3 [Quercus suber]
MASTLDQTDEHTPLLQVNGRRLSELARQDDQASSILESHVTIEEQKLADSSVGERLPYNDYTTIDWLHDLVKDSYRLRSINDRKGLRYQVVRLLDEASGWFAVAIIGTLTACVAFLVDVAEATVSDWKLGYCARNPFMNREACCLGKTPLSGNAHLAEQTGPDCTQFREWSQDYGSQFAIYVAFALAFGIISGAATMLTKRSLPAVTAETSDKTHQGGAPKPIASGKSMYMAAGSGIPEVFLTSRQP